MAIRDRRRAARALPPVRNPRSLGLRRSRASGRSRRRRRAARIREDDAGHRDRARESADGGAPGRIRAHGSRDAAQSRDHRDDTRRARADAALAPRHLRDRHGQPLAAARAAPSAARPHHRARTSGRGRRTALLARAARDPRDSQRLRRRRAHHRAHRAQIGAAARSLGPARNAEAAARTRARCCRAASARAWRSSPRMRSAHDDVVALLDAAIKPEPASVLREGGVIADGFDAELDELRAIQKNCGQFLLDLEARERARSGIANLKVEYNRVHGFYIEVTRAQTDKGAGRLPPPPDAEERRALHHAGAEGLRGQGALRRRSARSRARNCSTRSCSTPSRRIFPLCSAPPRRSPSSTCSRLSPSARPRSTGARRSSSTSR